MNACLRTKMAKTPVESGAKFDLSLDTEDYAQIERLSFEDYNESGCLREAVKRFQECTGHYPARVLAAQLYRTWENRRSCKEHGIRLSGPKLGRSGKTAEEDKKQKYQDNTDRIEVERSFSLGKRCCDMGLIVTKLKETQLTSIVLSVFVMNLFKIHHRILSALFYRYDIFIVQSDWLSLKKA